MTTDVVSAEAPGVRITACRRGAHLMTWTTEGVERLWMSPLSRPGQEEALRGGVPVLFPQFGTFGALPKHGFACNAVWRPHGQDDTSLLLELTPDDLSDEMRAAWPHQFQLRQKIDLAPGQLTVTLDVSNQGQTPFDFTTALHTYLRVADGAQVQLAGLERTTVWDTQAQTSTDFQPPHFGAAIDRIHHVPPPTDDDTFNELQMTLTTHGRTLTLRQSDTLPDVVVWNPGPDAGIADLPGDEWRQFVCVEAAAVELPVTVAPFSVAPDPVE